MIRTGAGLAFISPLLSANSPKCVISVKPYHNPAKFYILCTGEETVKQSYGLPEVARPLEKERVTFVTAL